MSEIHRLEEALKKAANEPEARADFYNLLLKSVVYVVGRPETGEDGTPNGHVKLKQWHQPDGTLALPFFATAESLRQILGEEDPALEMPALDLFRMSRGVTLVLTSKEASKAFKADEVEALLSSVMALDPLARALIRAVEENSEAARRNFYQTLVNSQVFVLGHPQNEEAQASESRDMKADDRFFFSACPHPFIKDQKVLPFFSSLDQMRRMLPGGGDSKYLGFQAMTFLTMARPLGFPLVLNLGSEPHKFFTDQELDSLMQSVRREPFETRRFKPGTKIFLGSPEEYPQEIVGALLDFLPQFPAVKAAYLAALREESEEAEQVLVIGFEGDGDLVDLFREAGELIGACAKQGQIIDFAKVQEGEQGLSQYFLEKVSPFYRRALKKSKPGSQPAAPSAETARPPRAQYDNPGFFGRLKRILGGTK